MLVNMDMFGESGGGNDMVYTKYISLSANAIINVNITGKAKRVWFVEDRGYFYSNYDPNTGDLCTTSLYYTSTPWTDNTFTESSSNYFIVTNGNITMNGAISTSARKLFLMYTLE